MNLPEISVRNPVTTLMIFFAAILVGAVCLTQMPVDLLPEMDLPAITVMTVYEGAAPEDVETKVTEALEQSLSTVPELKHITSKSKEGMSVITLQFEWGTDIDTRANEVRDAVGMAKVKLPDDVDEPRVMKFNMSSFPILVYGVTARESYLGLEKILSDQVADPLKRLPGVGAATAIVPAIRQINVDVDRERLASCGLTPLDVAQAVARENQDTPAGNVKMGLTDYLVRVPGEFPSVAPMRDIVLDVRDGRIIRLSDVGTVEDAFKETSYVITINSAPGAILLVQKQSGANTVDVARAVHARMEELKKRLPADVRIVNVMDSSEDIERTVSDLTQNMIIGGALTMLTVLLFLRRWRASLVIGLSLPFSLIVAVILMYFLGYTLNMMSLFGMIIAVGMIVDNAIVILENITRHREEGERPGEGAVYGASEVAMAVTASTLTTVCVFFPIFFVKGITRIFFSQFAIVISVALIGSLFSALTLTPMLAARLMGRQEFVEKPRGRLWTWSERIFDWMDDAYARSLAWALDHRWTVIGASLVMFVGSILLVPLMGTEFFPEEDRAMIQGTFHMPVGTRVEETARVMGELGRILNEEVRPEERVAVFTRCGTSATGMSSASGDEGAQVASVGVKLVPRTKRRRGVQEIAAALRRRFDAERGLLAIDRYALDVGDPMTNMLAGGEKPLTINVIGDDIEVTDALAAGIRDLVRNTPGTVDVNVSRVKGKPELWVNVDRAKASSLGLNVSGVGSLLRASFYGRQASTYRIHGDEYDIFVRLREPDRGDLSDVLATPIRAPSGEIIRVENVASTSLERGPLEIDRKDQGRIVNVTGNVYQRSLGEVVAEIRGKIDKLEVPPGVEVVIAGASEDQGEAFAWLSLALVVGIVLVYMVMASQFESLRDPFVVLFSIPFAFTGAIWANFVCGFHINIVTFLGVLLLIGVVVNNAIVLVDYTNILRARGLSMAEAVPLAGRTRLRPVLMTAVTTIVGVIPMAFGRGQGAEVWNPIGMTIMGGMIVSTGVTMVLVPTIYAVFESWRPRSSAKPWRGSEET